MKMAKTNQNGEIRVHAVLADFEGRVYNRSRCL